MNLTKNNKKLKKIKTFSYFLLLVILNHFLKHDGTSPPRTFAIIANHLCQKQGLLKFKDDRTNLSNHFTSLPNQNVIYCCIIQGCYLAEINLFPCFS